MTSDNSFLAWLEHLKPLWDFLTALGTVGLSAVTVYLANRTPKVHLALELSLLNEGALLQVRITNDADGAPVFLKCVWRNRRVELARVDNRIGSGLLNGHPAGMGSPRLANGDVFQIWSQVDEIATQAEGCIPKDIAPDKLDDLVRNSSLVCLTTTGKSFETPITREVQKVLTDRIRLIREKI